MIISCSECKKEVSDQAKLCPHCGAKIKSGHFSFISKFIFGSIAFLIIILIFQNATTPEYKKKAVEKRASCIEIAEKMAQIDLIPTCHDNYRSEIINGEMSEINYQSKNQGQYTNPSEKQRLEQEFKSECVINKNKIIDSIRSRSNRELEFLDRNRVERCAQLTGDTDFLKLIEEVAIKVKK